MTRNSTFDEPEPGKKLRTRTFDADYRPVNKSRKQEQELAAALGGRRVPGSGAFGDGGSGKAFDQERRSGPKGDVGLAGYLMEAKMTDRESIAISKSWLAKIDGEASRVGKTPAMALRFTNMAAGVPIDWTLIPTSVFKRFLKGD